MSLISDIALVMDPRFWQSLRDRLRDSRQSVLNLPLEASRSVNLVLFSGAAIGFRNNGAYALTVRVNADLQDTSYGPGQGYEGPIYELRVGTGVNGGNILLFLTGRAEGQQVITSAPGSTVGGSTLGTYGSTDGGTSWFPSPASPSTYIDENGNVLPVKKKLYTVAASQAYASVVAAVVGKKIRVLSYTEQCDGNVTCNWGSDTAGLGAAISGNHYNAANLGRVCAREPNGWFETAAGKALSLNTGVGGNTSGELNYVEV